MQTSLGTSITGNAKVALFFFIIIFGGGEQFGKQLVFYESKRVRFLSFYSKLWFEFARSYMANLP